MPRLPEIDLASLREVAWDQPQQWNLWLRVSSLSLAGVLSFFCTWSFGTSGTELELAKRQAATLESGREKTRLASLELEDIQQRAHELSSQIGVLKGNSLLADELPELLDLLSGLCADRSVVIETLQVENLHSRNLLDTQPLSLLLTGTYHQVGLLYEDLVNLPWPVVVQKFEIQANEETGDRLELRLSLLVVLAS